MTSAGHKLATTQRNRTSTYLTYCTVAAGAARGYEADGRLYRLQYGSSEGEHYRNTSGHQSSYLVCMSPTL
jgi:hypothetical protein